MSYIIQEFPQDKYRFRLYDNVKRLTWQQIQPIHDGRLLHRGR